MTRISTFSLLAFSLACFGGAHAATPAPEAVAPAKVADAVKDTAKLDTTPAAPVTTEPTEKSQDKSQDKSREKARCLESLETTVRPAQREHLKAFCDRVQRLPTCMSGEGRPIQHADSDSSNARGKRILVIGMIHGDEPLAGEMALEWEERLQKIDHRNAWRVVPMLNPDGLKRKTRMNARGVDLNRNFPTKDWQEEAIAFWKKTAKEDPRRYPGESAASEAETKCVIAHIKDFKPDFIVSVHTPYHVLDFDGPRMPFPRYKDLPWRALGNFPGSLGRYMWKDYQVPVLTIELGTQMVDAARLQDIIGSFAIDAARLSGQKGAGTFETL